jgi:hypothetical protein
VEGTFWWGEGFPPGRRRNFPIGRKGTLEWGFIKNERKPLTGKRALHGGGGGGGFPWEQRGLPDGEKGCSPREGSFPKEICPQGKGEVIIGDALCS